MDFERARRLMVETQVRTSDVTDIGVQQAMARIPRERFAPEAAEGLAYADLELEIAPGRYLLRPRDIAKLLQELRPQPGLKALEIAGASGYGAAVLAAIGCDVVTLDGDPALTNLARRAIGSCGLSTVVAGSGDAKAGWPDGAPFDLILINGAVEVVPGAWLAQLAEGGRLGVIVRRGAAGAARIYTKAGGVTAYRDAFDAAPPVIPGLEQAPKFVF